MGATPGLLHPSCSRKKAGSMGRNPQGAQSAKKGLGTNGITTPLQRCQPAGRQRASGKTRVGSDFQLSTGLFSALPAGRVGARLCLRPVGPCKPFKTVKNTTQNPAPEPEYGLSDPIGASRNAPYVQRVKMGNTGITTSRLTGKTGKTIDIRPFFQQALSPPFPPSGRAGAGQ